MFFFFLCFYLKYEPIFYINYHRLVLKKKKKNEKKYEGIFFSFLNYK